MLGLYETPLTFVAMLEYKAARYGRTFVRIGRFEPTSQVCSRCGAKDGPKPLHIRTWTCRGCGAVLDRDINAAVNIVLVAVNPGAAQTLTFDLSRFGQVTGGTGWLVPRWSSRTSGTGDPYTARRDTALDGKRLSVPFAEQSVQTFQIDGVVE